MKLVKFTQLVREAQTETREGEDDTVETVQIGPETRAFYVNPETVRSVRARNEGPGTRIEFPNSSAVVVFEPADEVVAMLTA